MQHRPAAEDLMGVVWTPLKWEQWEAELVKPGCGEEFLDVIEGIWRGFKIGVSVPVQ